MKVPEGLHPILITQTRYGGSIEGGTWVAFANTDLTKEGDRFCVELAFSEPASAGEWWSTYRDQPWVAVDYSPTNALRKLIAQNT